MENGVNPQRKIFRVSDLAAAGSTVQSGEKRVRELSIDYFLIVRVMNGQRHIRYRGCECRVNSREYMLMTPGTYDIDNVVDGSGFYRSDWLAWDTKLLLPEDPIEKLLKPFEGATALPPMDGEFTIGFIEARRALEMADALPIDIVRHRVIELSWWLRHHGLHLSTPRLNSLDKQIQAMVARSPSSEWNIATLASALDVSEATLRRRLGALGVTPSDVIVNARMSYAIGLLQSTDLSIAEISSKVGYESPPRFASRFRIRFGFSPSELRGHRRGNSDDNKNFRKRQET